MNRAGDWDDHAAPASAPAPAPDVSLLTGIARFLPPGVSREDGFKLIGGSKLASHIAGFLGSVDAAGLLDLPITAKVE